MIELFSQIQFQFQAYVVLAMLLGAAIGIDRKIADKPAGLRTHMLVAGAAALLVSLGNIMVQHSTRIFQIIFFSPTRYVSLKL